MSTKLAVGLDLDWERWRVSIRNCEDLANRLESQVHSQWVESRMIVHSRSYRGPIQRSSAEAASAPPVYPYLVIQRLIFLVGGFVCPPTTTGPRRQRVCTIVPVRNDSSSIHVSGQLDQATDDKPRWSYSRAKVYPHLEANSSLSGCGATTFPGVWPHWAMRCPNATSTRTNNNAVLVIPGYG